MQAWPAALTNSLVRTLDLKTQESSPGCNMDGVIYNDKWRELSASLCGKLGGDIGSSALVFLDFIPGAFLFADLNLDPFLLSNVIT